MGGLILAGAGGGFVGGALGDPGQVLDHLCRMSVG